MDSRYKQSQRFEASLYKGDYGKWMREVGSANQKRWESMDQAAKGWRGAVGREERVLLLIEDGRWQIHELVTNLVQQAVHQ